MFKLKLNTVTRNENATWVLHISLYNDTAPDKILTNLSVSTETLTSTDIQIAIDTHLKPKIAAWKQKEDKKTAALTMIQNKLDQIVI